MTKNPSRGSKNLSSFSANIYHNDDKQFSFQHIGRGPRVVINKNDQIHENILNDIKLQNKQLSETKMCAYEKKPTWPIWV